MVFDSHVLKLLYYVKRYLWTKKWCTINPYLVMGQSHEIRIKKRFGTPCCVKLAIHSVLFLSPIGCRRPGEAQFASPLSDL